MSDSGTSDWSLLPAGLQDLLAPDAAEEAAAVTALLSCFHRFGYEQVKPPLMEFEEALLSGTGASLHGQTFRLMDPVSQRMLGLRADITPQIVRLAASRLNSQTRPLRLCYSGDVLQVRGGQLRPERQFTQVGVELIEADQPVADAEVISLGAEALLSLGVKGLSVDLNLPPLIRLIFDGLALEPEREKGLRRALDEKDREAVHRHAGSQAPPFIALLEATGPAERALPLLSAVDLTGAAAREVTRLVEVVERVQRLQPDLKITLDPTEHRGFEYQTGVSFVYFARAVRGELGRGGRYETPAAGRDAEVQRRSSTGFTLFMDSILRALPASPRGSRVFVPANADPAITAALREQGWVTVMGLDEGEDSKAQAQALGCDHHLVEGTPQPVDL